MKKALSLILSLIMILTPVTALGADYGVDVSHNNDTVDFVEVKNSGKSFAMIRVGYYNHLDKKFAENIKAAYEAGMEFGVYLYSYAFNEEEAEIEAQFVINTLASLGEYGSKRTLPVAYDLEDKQVEALGAAQMNRNIQQFCTTIQNAGYVPMVFSSYYFFNTYIDTAPIVKNGWKLWLAKWESNPDFSAPKEIKSGVYADMWQYQKGDAAQAGVLKYDQNIAYDLASLKSITVPQPAVTPVDITALRPVVKKLTASKRKLNVKWKKTEAADGYEIQYSLNKSFKKKQTVTKTVKGSKKSLTVKKLKSKKKYYVRIRAYQLINGEKVCSKWSKKKAVKVK